MLHNSGDEGRLLALELHNATPLGIVTVHYTVLGNKVASLRDETTHCTIQWGYGETDLPY